MNRRPLHTYTVKVTQQSVTLSGGHASDHTDRVVPVMAPNRRAAAMEARRELERQQPGKAFVLTFREITRHGDPRPWLRLPEASSPTGASMGRSDLPPADPSQPLRMHLQRMPLDSGGYDDAGSYWGHGMPLYWAISTALTQVRYNRYQDPFEGRARVFVRAKSREQAKELIREVIPGATFFR